MKAINTKLIFILMVSLLCMTSCKDQEEKTVEVKLDYPEHEIPVSTKNQDALTAFKNGMEAYEIGKYREARPYFDEALKQDPNFVSAQIYRAYTNSSAKDWSVQRNKALAMSDKANAGETLIIGSLEASMNGDREKELQYYNELASKYPKSAQAQDYLAVYYLGNDENERARDIWKNALEMNPEYIPALTGLGRSYALDSPVNFNDAEKYLLQAVKLRPNNSKAYIDLGDGYRAQNKLDQALENYIKATQLNPKDDTAHMKAGHASNMLGNYQAARMHFTEAQKVSEFGVNGNGFIAYTYLYDGDYNKAMELLIEDVSEVDTMNIPDSNKNIAKYSATIDAAQIAMHFNNIEKLNMLVAAMKPYSKQIIKDVASSAVTSNQNAFMLYWDGMAAVAANDYTEAAAKAEASKAALASIKNPNKLRQYHFLQGMIHYKKGNFEKAKEHFTQSNQDYVYNKYWLAKTYEKLGDLAKAKNIFNEVKVENFNSIGNALVKKEMMEME